MVLSIDRGCEGAPLLVVLHGLGAPREVWWPMRDLAERHWRGRWIAPHMPGHSRSPKAEDYLPAAQGDKATFEAARGFAGKPSDG